VELSGNIFSAYYNLFTQNREINRPIFGVKYSQYYRADLDISFYNTIDNKNAIVYRGFVGLGLPYGNTRFLPFERRFFVGGSNSLRAWRPRTIGPGGFGDDKNSISIDKTGEVMLQGNIEYRFNILERLLYGAWFFDAGNIWNMRKDDNFSQAEFNFNRFYKEIAINSGIGMRWDFSYFVFCIDWGVALRDPTFSAGERWVILDFPSPSWIRNNSAINLAIGYPF
jgi:outer membrane protein assembly factor BamA